MIILGAARGLVEGEKYRPMPVLTPSAQYSLMPMLTLTKEEAVQSLVVQYGRWAFDYS